MALIAAPATRQLAPTPRRRLGPADAWVIVGFVLFACYVFGQLWLNVDQATVTGAGRQDQDQTEWFLSHAAYSVAHGTNPLFTDRLNVPAGVNMMANTTVLGIGIPAAPLTLSLGPHVTYVLLLTLSLAGTAAGWHVLLRKLLGCSVLASALGAALCGFGPPMISHANGHLNFVAQVLVPIIVWRTAALISTTRPVRDSVLLGLLVTYQAFVGEEILLLTALGCGVFLAIWALQNPRQAKEALAPFFSGIAFTAGIAGGLLLYPLWRQFFGYQHYDELPEGTTNISADLLSITAWPNNSIGEKVSDSHATALMLNASEGNTFFGLVLPIVVVGAVLMLWRQTLVRALSLTALIFLVLSLGPRLLIGWHETALWLPWRAFRGIPLLSHIVPARFGLVVLPICGVLVALGLDELRKRSGRLRGIGYVAIVAALVPLFPLPIPVVVRAQTPEFFASGMWRDYVSPGRTIVTLPLPSTHTDAMRWAAEQNLGYAIPRGYFLSPVSADGRADFSPPPRAMDQWFEQVARSGQVPIVGPAQQQEALDDLRYWRADVVVLPPQPRDSVLLETAERLFGPAEHVAGIWLWDVRYLAEANTATSSTP